jgi:hypothetical protein
MHDMESIEKELFVGYCLLVRVFKNRWFARFADKEGITDGELKEAVNQLEAGQADANLSGNVYKVRVARPGEGKSGAYRVIIFFRSEERSFYTYGYAKSVRGNIDKGELRILKNRSKDALSMTDGQINDRLKNGTLIEAL